MSLVVQLFEYLFDMDLMENYPFKDKDFAFVALYASMFEKYTEYLGKKNPENSRNNMSISAVLSHISDT